MTVEYKCIDVYKKPENPMEWLPCPRCGLRPFCDDGVVKLYMPIPPISLALEGDRGILNIGEFKRKEIDYEQK